MPIDGGYRRLLRAPFISSRSARKIIGGEFEAFGTIEAAILRHYGLRASDSLVDIGCGAGRLTRALAPWFEGSYLGTDVVPSLLRTARKEGRPGWQFALVRDVTIPMADGAADVVCFYSVLTHLPHEASYLYLEEARRVLRPGGRVVFSFLEYRSPAHWLVFENSVAAIRQRRAGQTLNVFITRSAIEAWVARLGFDVVELRDGSDAFVPLEHPVTLDDGTVMEQFGCLGQSIAVLERQS
jgi:SAM-dependent methyltransferase